MEDPESPRRTNPAVALSTPPLVPQKRETPILKDSAQFVRLCDAEVDALVAGFAFSTTPMNAVEACANDLNTHSQVQAYAKIAGRNWTYYVQRLDVAIGRTAVDSTTPVDIDLGPSKVVSRLHARITYDLRERLWQLHVVGRNGVRLDRQSVKNGAAPLRSGSILEIAGAQMMFVLPDQAPLIARSVLVTRGAHKLATGPRKSSRSPRRSPPPKVKAPRPRPLKMMNHENGQDLSLDEHRDVKPPYSYAIIITKAILSSPEEMMSLADIYAWVAANFAFYRHSKPGWQNSIRHNLSLNRAFIKVPRKQNEPGKGSKWMIASEEKEAFAERAQAGKYANVSHSAGAVARAGPEAVDLARAGGLPDQTATPARPKTGKPDDVSPSMWKYLVTPIREDSVEKRFIQEEYTPQSFQAKAV